ncbi:acyltransferase family protein [Pseudarthrobacter sp. J1738]|uniref:acyltransferase family protein n=1 Tax=Pseudarthrobacter sp. J1738 TaxID=3420446 RepID=UPI003D2B8EAA
MSVNQAITLPTRRDVVGPKSKVRTDIQALRALAVGAVVLNHLWPDRLPGGYVGVDIFFVISGFLITRHLVGELTKRGRVHFAAFYARRMRRLLPAALLVGALGLAGTWLFMPYSRWADAAGEGIAAAFYGENWLLAAKSVDYSASQETATVVQHYWSLSVEEQFYVVWPLLLAGAFAAALWRRKNPLRFLTIAMSVVFAASLIFSIIYTVTNPNEAYFVTTTRAWEFAAGGLIALGTVAFLDTKASQRRSPSKLVQNRMQLLAGIGLIAVLVTLFVYNQETTFPGAMALIPVVGTGLIIWTGSVLGSSAIPFSGFRPFQFVGDVSYSLYLWHWPLIVLAVPFLGRELGNVDKWIIAAISLALAFLSKRYIEDPGRTKLYKGRRSAVSLLAGFGAMLLVTALALGMVLSAGRVESAEAQKLANLAQQPCYGASSLLPNANCPDKYGSPDVLNIGKAQSPYFAVSGCRSATDQIVVQDVSFLQDCDYSGGDKNAKTVWYVGDSHAEHWKVAFFDLARKQKWHVRLSLAGGCSLADVKRIAFMDAPRLDSASQERCLQWSQQVSDKILKQKPDYVVTSTFSVKETIDDGTGRDQLAQYKDTVERRQAKWAQNGTRVIVIRDPPLTLGKSTPGCVIQKKGDSLACATDRSKALVADPTAKAALDLGSGNLKVMDLSDQFCDAKQCHAVIGGIFVYFDNNHLSKNYVESLEPIFDERLLGLMNSK